MTATAVMNPVDISQNREDIGRGTLQTENRSYQIKRENIFHARDFLVTAIRKFGVNTKICTRPHATHLGQVRNEPKSLQTRNVNHLEISTLLFKIMMLLADNRVLERLIRKAEHDEQIRFLLQTVSNFMDQGSSLKNTAIAGAVMSFVAAFLPMFGYTSWGEKFKGWISPLNKMETPEAFKRWGEMADIGRKVSENVGQMQTAYREGDRAFSQQKTDIARTNVDESGRAKNHIDEDLRNILTFFLRLLEAIMQEIKAGFN